MRIQGLELENYRNFDKEHFNPNPGINIIYGDNAQGKTNLIEAIWLFTGGRSFSGAKDIELVKFGTDYAKLNLEFLALEREQEAEINIMEKRRKVSLNKVEKKSPSALIGAFCAVVFSPSHLSLVKDGPLKRRRFLDAALCQMKPKYCSALLRYNHTLGQRNALLKEAKANRPLLETLDIWDRNLSLYGSLIIKERLNYVSILEAKAGEFYRGISDGKEEFSVLYKSNLIKSGIIDNIEESFFSALEAHREEDLLLGYTSVGPHRDDLVLKVNNLNAKSFASQGQQRSCVLSLKLAEAEIFMKNTGQKPIILLDDVMSELDAKRQTYLMESIKDWQVLLTCCDPDNIIRLDYPQKFEIKNGKINSF